MNNNTLLIIGKKVREIRTEKNLKLVEVADKAGISKGLLSKVENGRTIPSLPVLLQIIRSLNVGYSFFFEGVEEQSNYLYIHKKKEDYSPLEKEDSIGFNYLSVLSENTGQQAFQAAILNLEPDAQRSMVLTDGYEFLYMIKGSVEYHLDNEVVHLKEGESLFFNGRIPHVPKNHSDQVVKILVIYLLTTHKD